MDDYIRIPIRKEEHQELVRLQNELTGKIDSYLRRPSLSDIIRYLLDKQERTMHNEMPDTIYETPDDWGQTTYATREEMLDIIQGLKKLGPDWKSIELDDCTEWSLVNGNIYETYPNERAEFAPLVGHEEHYKLVETVDN